MPRKRTRASLPKPAPAWPKSRESVVLQRQPTWKSSLRPAPAARWSTDQTMPNRFDIFITRLETKSSRNGAPPH
ncbi:MAG: hypothetical protein E5V16_18905, partial [Mesorhizobium sp.]